MSRFSVRPSIVPVVLNAGAAFGIQGEIEVIKYDRWGRRTPVRVDRNRRAFQRVWEHRQHNLITNSGMDHLGGSAFNSHFSTLANAIAVGTSSVAPQVTDTGLGSELARSNTTLDITTDNVWSHPTAGQQTMKRGRAFDFGIANGNLTEFGGFLAASGGNALTRELFRDETDAPVVILKTSDDQLVVDYTLRVTYGPTSLTSVDSINVAGLGSFALEHMFYRGFPAGTSTTRLVNTSWRDLRLAPLTVFASVYDTGTSGTNSSGGGIAIVSNPPAAGQTVQAYAGGTHYLDYTAVQGALPSTYNVPGFQLNFHDGSIPFAVCGWKFASPAVLEKSLDYRLTLNARLAWSRT